MEQSGTVRSASMIIIAAFILSCSCATVQDAVPPAAPLALWEGRWQSSLMESTTGTVRAVFPDPLPAECAFTVRAVISYGGGASRIEKSIETAMTGYYAEEPGGDAATPRRHRLRFKGVINETGQTITYDGHPDHDLREFRGSYISEKPDDRGTFILKKMGPAPRQ